MSPAFPWHSLSVATSPVFASRLLAPVRQRFLSPLTAIRGLDSRSPEPIANAWGLFDLFSVAPQRLSRQAQRLSLLTRTRLLRQRQVLSSLRQRSRALRSSRLGAPRRRLSPSIGSFFATHRVASSFLSYLGHRRQKEEASSRYIRLRPVHRRFPSHLQRDSRTLRATRIR